MNSIKNGAPGLIERWFVVGLMVLMSKAFVSHLVPESASIRGGPDGVVGSIAFQV